MTGSLSLTSSDAYRRARGGKVGGGWRLVLIYGDASELQPRECDKAANERKQSDPTSAGCPQMIECQSTGQGSKSGSQPLCRRYQRDESPAAVKARHRGQLERHAKADTQPETTQGKRENGKRGHMSYRTPLAISSD